MVAGVQDQAGHVVAAHRTFLLPDGHDKARVRTPRLALGPCRGGAVRLGFLGDELLLAEGIETALSGQQATGTTAWAAISASGLKVVQLPPQVRRVTILADGDQPGREAARDAAARFTREGREVRVAYAPDGQDLNDAMVRP